MAKKRKGLLLRKLTSRMAGGGPLSTEPVDLSPDEVRKQLHQLKQRMSEGFWDMARLLFHTWDKKLWEKWGYAEGSEGFTAFVEKETDIQRSSAYNILSVWNWFVIKEGGKKEVLDKIRQVGWRKIVAMVEVVTEKNVDQWVNKAAKTGVFEFERDAKEYRAKHEAGGDGGKRSPITGEQGGRVKAMQFLFQGDQVDTVEDAIKHAGSISGSKSKSELMSLICLDYNSTRRWAGDSKKDIAATMKQFEALTGTRIVVLKKKGTEVVYGEDSIVAWSKEMGSDDEAKEEKKEKD